MGDVGKQIEEQSKAIAKSIAVLDYRDKFSSEADMRVAEYCIYKAVKNEKMASRWRKVSEELPPMSTEILLRLVDGSHQIGYYLPHKYRDDNFYNHCESDIEFLLLDVVEWKPIG